MKIRLNWLQVVCAGVLAFGLVLLPTSALAQTKSKHSGKHSMKHSAKHSKKHPTKGHKAATTKKTHGHHAHRSTRKGHLKANEDRMPTPPPATFEEHISRTPPTPPVLAVAPTPAGPVAGTRYDENAWREFHPDWNGKYTYENGKYYFDPEMKYPAEIPSDFNSIVAKFGGIATLENDPTLVFTGDSGEPYPILQYNSDRYRPDKKLKLKSAFFGRSLFWRDGVRYDRKMIVDSKGVRCFQFVKHT